MARERERELVDRVSTILLWDRLELELRTILLRYGKYKSLVDFLNDKV